MDFEGSLYRKNLAEEIANEPDKKKRQILLENAKGAQKYQSAAAGRSIEGQREKLRSGESKEVILEGAEAFTEAVLGRYPQVTDEGKLNYYFAGSLSVMLLLKAGKFEILDESKIPEIVPIAEKEVPLEAVKYLGEFVRKIGDLDFVQTKLYTDQKHAINNSYGTIPSEEYSRRKKQFLSKGGGGPRIEELSDTAKKVLKNSEKSGGIMCDPMGSVTADRVVQIKIGEQDVYIPEPRMMLAYKTVHLGQNFETASKTDKFVSDFNAMLKGMETMYSREELLQTSYETMFAHLSHSPNDTFIPYHNPKFRGALRKFYEELLALDTDSAYLNQLEYGKERSIGLLKILHQYTSPEAKHAIIDFFNTHKAQIDIWSINSTSPKNREVVADFLISQPELLAEFQTKVKCEATKEAIVESLSTQVWALNTYGQKIPDKSTLEMSPNSNYIMDVLMKIDESNVNQELNDVGTLVDLGMDAWNLNKILGADYSSTTEQRVSLLRGLIVGREKLGDKDFRRFSSLLSMAVSDSDYIDPKSGSFVDIKNNERPEKIAAIFADFGINYIGESNNL